MCLSELQRKESKHIHTVEYKPNKNKNCHAVRDVFSELSKRSAAGGAHPSKELPRTAGEKESIYNAAGKERFWIDTSSVIVLESRGRNGCSWLPGEGVVIQQARLCNLRR